MIVSIGTSGVVCAVSATPVADGTGTVAGFADATGRWLPLCATINGAHVLTSTAAVLGVDLDELSRLALQAPPGADGLVLVPYLEGERTPDRPDATSAAAICGVVTTRSSADGSRWATEMAMSPVPGGRSSSRTSRSPQ